MCGRLFNRLNGLRGESFELRPPDRNIWLVVVVPYRHQATLVGEYPWHEADGCHAKFRTKAREELHVWERRYLLGLGEQCVELGTIFTRDLGYRIAKDLGSLRLQSRGASNPCSV